MEKNFLIRFLRTPLRPMTKDEIEGHWQALHRQIAWKSVRDFALNLYGPHAYRIEIKTGSEYDDEGGYYTTLENVTVYDKEDNLLEFDLSMQWWQTEPWFVHSSDDRRTNVEYLRDQVREATGQVLSLYEEHQLMLEEAQYNRYDLFSAFGLPVHQDRDENIYTLDLPPFTEQLPQLYASSQISQNKFSFFMLLLIPFLVVIGYQSIIGLLKRVWYQRKPGER